MPRSFLAPLLVLPLLLVPAAALAAPATEAEMNLYGSIAAVNLCLSRAAGVAFDKALGVAGETIALIIRDRHEGLISLVGPKPLTIEELFNGASRYAVFGASRFCPKELPADVMAKVKEALNQQPLIKPGITAEPAVKSGPAK